jgi:hypothetical protein
MNQTQPHTMTTEERLDEISSILAKAIARVQKRAEISAFGESSTGLHRQAKRPCHDKK